MSNPKKHSDGITFRQFESITPSDTTGLNINGFVCSGSGDVEMEDYGGNTVTLTILAGAVYHMAPKYIKAATTATGIIGLS